MVASVYSHHMVDNIDNIKEKTSIAKEKTVKSEYTRPGSHRHILPRPNVSHRRGNDPSPPLCVIRISLVPNPRSSAGKSLRKVQPYKRSQSVPPYSDARKESHSFKRTHSYIYTQLPICLSINLTARARVCVYIYVYMYTHTHTNTHIYIYITIIIFFFSLFIYLSLFLRPSSSCFLSGN